jgi:hypothetical protein
LQDRIDDVYSHVQLLFYIFFCSYSIRFYASAYLLVGGSELRLKSAAFSSSRLLGLEATLFPQIIEFSDTL